MSTQAMEVMDWESDDELEETLPWHWRSSQFLCEDGDSISDQSSQGPYLAPDTLDDANMDDQSRELHEAQGTLERLKIKRDDLMSSLSVTSQVFDERKQEIAALEADQESIIRSITCVEYGLSDGKSNRQVEYQDVCAGYSDEEIVQQIHELMKENERLKAQKHLFRQQFDHQVRALQHISEEGKPFDTGYAGIGDDINGTLSDVLADAYVAEAEVIDEPEVMEWFVDNEIEDLLKHNDMLKMQHKLCKLQLENNMDSYHKARQDVLSKEADCRMVSADIQRYLARISGNAAVQAVAPAECFTSSEDFARLTNLVDGCFDYDDAKDGDISSDPGSCATTRLPEEAVSASEFSSEELWRGLTPDAPDATITTGENAKESLWASFLR